MNTGSSQLSSQDFPEFDYIIVGGGSAGCVMASRLSAQPALRVLLIEAGSDFSSGNEPDALSDARCRVIFDTRFVSLSLTESMVRGQGAGVGPMLIEPRVMGGGSSINGMHAQRGFPRDYDEWGVEGWTWDDLLPFFKQLETDLDCNGPLHGKSGPIRIQRVPDTQWAGISRAIREVVEKKGIPRVQDMNTTYSDGVGPVPLNNPLERVSNSWAYLTDEVRHRPNLKIMADTGVAKLLMEGRRVLGVQLDTRSGQQNIRAANTILCAGAIHSPTLLLRSGIGPAASLQEMGIPVVVDRPGVGKNLRGHPTFSISAHLRRSARQKSRVRPPCVMIVRYSSRHPGCPSTDMLINLWERVPGALARDPLSRQIASFMLICNRPVSPGGEVLLNSADPLMGAPRVRLNCFADPRDLERMVDGFRFMVELLTTRPASDLVNDVFIPKHNPLTQILLRGDAKAKVVSSLGSIALGGPAWLRRRMLKKTSNPILDLIRDPEAAAALVKTNTSPSTHPSGTCRLGNLADKQAVIDSRCRVIGVDNLRVVDTSIFPNLMTAGTNIPVIMAAEKAAAMAIEDLRATSPAAVVERAHSR